MRDLDDGESTEVQGSGSSVYTIKNVGGVYSCSCPAWRNQSLGIERRTCKHIRGLRGEAAERERLALEESVAFSTPAKRAPSGKSTSAKASTSDEPPVLLAHRWEGDVDLAGWWMSEKLDGVRAYWDGQQILSRLGNPFVAPAWFTAPLPKTPLDGELWIGRKQFQRTVSVVRRQDASDAWKEVRYVVFDAPAMKAPFEERMDFLEKSLAGIADHVCAHKHEPCRDTQHLRTELARVEALGGEGVMLRKPGSFYEAGRSSTLLKVKSFLDAEARVLEHVDGLGRHKGRMGALVVEMPDGTRFNVGTGFSDAERESPPPIGSIITYRYQELSEAGVPRFPSFVAIRDDIAFPAAKTAAKPATKPAAKPAAPVDKAPAKASPTSAVPASGKARRFEFSEGASNKFWEIQLEGSGFCTRHGKIGAAGLSTSKSFSSPAEAQKEYDKLVAEKVKKGYVEA